MPRHAEPIRGSRQLGPEEASRIRDEVATGRPVRIIAIEFNVPESTIKAVVKRHLFGDTR